MSLFSSKVERMTPGQVLLDQPISEFVSKMGLAIAKAQRALDENAVAMAAEMAQTKTDISDKSLLELGLTPTFYHVTEAELEVKMEMTMRVEQEIGINLGLKLGSGQTTPTTPDAPVTATPHTITLTQVPASQGNQGSGPEAGDEVTLTIDGVDTDFTVAGGQGASQTDFALGANARATADNLVAEINGTLTSLNATAKDGATATEAIVEIPAVDGQTVAATFTGAGFVFTAGQAAPPPAVSAPVNGGSSGTNTGGNTNDNSGGAEEQPKTPKVTEKKGAVMWGISVNAHYHRRYELEVSGSSRVTWKIVSLPAPAQLMDELAAINSEE